MRGKSIMWLALIALLLATPTANVRAQSTTTIYIDPPLTTGLIPGDIFAVSIMVTGAADLKSWEIGLSYAPYLSQISPVEFIEGDFLMIGGETYFAKYVDTFHGELMMGATLIGDVFGVSGDGWLGTIVFSVLEAGHCTLDLHDTILLDSTGAAIPHDAIDAEYLGPTADLSGVPGIIIRPRNWRELWQWITCRTSYVGDAREFYAKVTNVGYAPLDVRAKFTSVNAKTGATYVFYGGQQFMSTITTQTVTLYANEQVPVFGEWVGTGTSPYLDAAGDGSYITGTEYCQLSDVFGFQDIAPLGPMDSIIEVRLEGYTRSAHNDIDFDMYVWDSFAWLGSLWGGTDWEWKTPRWTTTPVSGVDPSTRTEAGLNAFQVLAHYYTPDGSPMGDADLDCLRLVVTIQTGGTVPTTPPVYEGLLPSESYTTPVAIWYLTEADKGIWYTTVEIQYLYNYDPRFPLVWLVGDTATTYIWWCLTPWPWW